MDNLLTKSRVSAFSTFVQVFPSHTSYNSFVFQVVENLPTLHEVKAYVQKSLSSIRNDHLRALNPTPYKVCF